MIATVFKEANTLKTSVQLPEEEAVSFVLAKLWKEKGYNSDARKEMQRVVNKLMFKRVHRSKDILPDILICFALKVEEYYSDLMRNRLLRLKLFTSLKLREKIPKIKMQHRLCRAIKQDMVNALKERGLIGVHSSDLLDYDQFNVSQSLSSWKNDNISLMTGSIPRYPSHNKLA